MDGYDTHGGAIMSRSKFINDLVVYFHKLNDEDREILFLRALLRIADLELASLGEEIRDAAPSVRIKTERPIGVIGVRP